MKTFFMVKPDGVKRNIVGQVIDRVEQEGFKITKMKMMTITSELLSSTMVNTKINHSSKI